MGGGHPIRRGDNSTPRIPMFRTIAMAVMMLCLALLWSTTGVASSHHRGAAPPSWGWDCPRECQCHSTSLGHVTMARWVDPTRHGGGAAVATGARGQQQSNWLHRTFGGAGSDPDDADEDNSADGEEAASDASATNSTGGQAAMPVKVAMCLLGQDTLLSKLWRKIPFDTQVLTVLQTQDSPPMVLMEQHVRHLQHLLALEVRGHASSPTTCHLALGSDALRPLRRLQYLSLASVDLSAQPVGLAKKRALRYLNLEHNQLEALPRESLIGQLALEELAITRNDFREIPPLAFIDMPALRNLQLQDNRLQTLDANSFVSMDTLETLDLSRNNISDVSMLSFPPLPRLRWLHLQDNPIAVVFLNAFHLLNTTESVTLGHTSQPTHIMKMSFVGLNSLRALTLDNLDNQILERDMFQGLASLRSLVLRGRHLRVIGPESFVGAHQQLERLVLGGSAGGGASGGGQLRRLAPDAFHGLKSLKALSLAGNHISKLPLGLFDPLKSLQELELQNNQLHYLPAQLIAHLHVQMLRLEKNPWHCTCAMAKWPRAALSRARATGKRCAALKPFDAAANTLDSGIGGGVGGGGKGGSENRASSTAAISSSAATSCESSQRRPYVRVRDLSTRPTCHTPEELRGKRVLEAVRKDLHCHDQS